MQDGDPGRERSDEESVSERRWDELFRRSPELLEKLANEALAELKAGRTQPLDPDNL